MLNYHGSLDCTPVRQTWMAPSQPPLTNRLPSGLTPTDAKESAWPLRTATHSR